MKPDESLFKTHLEGASFQAGADEGKWGLHGESKDIKWPIAFLWVQSDKTLMPVGRIFLRFNPEGYSAQAPTSCPWNVEKDARLEDALWPKLSGKFAKVFRLDWQGGTALYAPCDRVAMVGHEQQWKQHYPFWWWQPHFTFVKYLEFVHRCLNPNRHANGQA